MQFCIELPDDLEPEILQQADVKQLITDAVKKILLEKHLISQTNNFPFEKLEALRARQTQSENSSLEHLQALRNEARY